MEFKVEYRRALVIYLLSALIGLLITQVALNAKKYRDALDAADAQLKHVIAQEESLVPFTEQEAKELYAAVVNAGNAVADLQTSYQVVNSSGTGIEDVADKLDVYFAASDKNSRVPWYMNSKLAGIVCRWKFSNIIRLDRKEIRVSWTCYSSSGVLVAYATGTYRVNDGLFCDVTYATTSEGVAISGVDVNEPDHSTEFGSTD